MKLSCVKLTTSVDTTKYLSLLRTPYFLHQFYIAYQKKKEKKNYSFSVAVAIVCLLNFFFFRFVLFFILMVCAADLGWLFSDFFHRIVSTVHAVWNFNSILFYFRLAYWAMEENARMYSKCCFDSNKNIHVLIFTHHFIWPNFIFGTNHTLTHVIFPLLCIYIYIDWKGHGGSLFYTPIYLLNAHTHTYSYLQTILFLLPIFLWFFFVFEVNVLYILVFAYHLFIKMLQTQCFDELIIFFGLI